MPGRGPRRCGPSSRRRGTRAASRDRVLLGHLPAHRVDAALVHAAGRLRLRGRRAGDLPPDRAGGHRAGLRRRGQGARPGGRGRDARRRLRRRHRRALAYLAAHPRSTAPRSAPPGTAPAATSRSARRCGPRSARPCAGTPTGLHDGKLGKDPDAGSLARADEIGGELLLIWGTRDPHTPQHGARPIRRRLDDSPVRLTWSDYDAEHAFGRDEGHRYDPEATDLAFAETVALFRGSF